MTTGTINVQTENIFPIIKKFLYSEHEIFLRELVSNAVDATQKLKLLSSMGEAKGNLGKLVIEVVLDKGKKTLTVKDKGIGMTAEEVEKYINQIAFSGAEEFLNKYKDKTEGAGIIGHFGLGFYSSFMVADKVEIISKSYKEDKAVQWECDGNPKYTLVESDRKERGTDIILHLYKDAEEFLEENRIRELLKKYCKFLPVEIKFEKDIINNTQPAWTKKPADLKEEDYKKFYQELYPFTFDEPLFNIHLNVDYPFHLTGILYFPKLKNRFEIQKNKIQLYCNQVFVTDSVEGIVPEFLTLLHGVIDSPDIPLNVSRSFLQGDPNIKKISSHVTKKVADKLEEMFKNDRKGFEEKWNDIKIFIEYGMLSEDKFYERAINFALYKNIEGKYFTTDEYTTKIKEQQTDKDGKVVYLYANQPDEQYTYIQQAKEKGYDILLMDGPIASHLIGKLESKMEKVSFVRVDADTVEKLIQKNEIPKSNLSEEQQKQLKQIIEGVVAKEKFNITFEALDEKNVPVMITQPEFMRRMKEMSELGGGGMYGGNFPDSYTMVVNSNHPIISKILIETDAKKQNQLTKQITDLALLSQNMLKGEELTKFIKRSMEWIK